MKTRLLKASCHLPVLHQSVAAMQDMEDNKRRGSIVDIASPHANCTTKPLVYCLLCQILSFVQGPAAKLIPTAHYAYTCFIVSANQSCT